MKSVASILGSLVLLVVLGVLGFLWWQSRQGAHQLAKAEAVAGQAVVAKDAALTKADAIKILSNAKVREIHTVTIQGANHAAIMQAKGADAPIDPELIRTTNRGLCLYFVYRYDSGCLQVRSGLARIIPPTRPRSGPTLP